jgi:hypothetical protein
MLFEKATYLMRKEMRYPALIDVTHMNGRRNWAVVNIVSNTAE